MNEHCEGCKFYRIYINDEACVEPENLAHMNLVGKPDGVYFETIETPKQINREGKCPRKKEK